MFWAVSLTQAPSQKVVTGTQVIADIADEDPVANVDKAQEEEQKYVVDHDDLMNNKVKAKVRSLLWYMVLIPFVLSVSLWLLGTYATKDYLPSSLDVHLWRNFSAHVKESVQEMDTKYPHNVLLVLLGTQAIQVLFCFPLLHVTKIMYGYFFDTVTGGLIACMWELFLVGLFMIVATQNNPVRAPALELAAFLAYVGSLRYKRMLFLVAMHVSSVPLITSTCLVLFHVVTRTEFWVSHVIATVCMTFKDTWLGNFLASSDGNAGNIAIAATMMSVSALLPTVVTIIIMAFITTASASASKTSSYKSFTRV